MKGLLHSGLSLGTSRIALVGAIICASALGSAGAWAQEAGAAAAETADSAVGEIIVTAQRRSENIQKVPIAITAADAETLERANVNSVSDLGTLAPSLNFIAEAAFSQPRLRGIGTPSNGPGIESAVALYIDGVYQAAMVGGNANFNNIKAVEVINGPQGTLFGRNATGGLIHIRTLDPSYDFGGNVSLGYGNYDTFTASGYVTGGLSKTVAMDVAIDYSRQADGYGVNLLDGREVDKTKSIFTRSKIVFEPSDSAKFTLSGNYGHIDFDPLAAPAPGSEPFGGKLPGLNPHQFATTQASDGFVEQYGGSLTGDIDLGGVNLLSITAYQATNSSTLFGDLTDNIALASNIRITEPHRQFSQELQFSSPAGGDFTWTAGLYFFRETAKYDPVNLFGPLYELGGVSDIRIFTNTKTTSYSAYAQGTYAIAEDTRLTAGFRYTIDKRSTDILQEVDIIGFGTITDQTVGKKTFRAPTWRISLDHNFTPDVLGYVSYNRGFKSGGFNPAQFPAQSFEPEKLDAYEVGLKTQFADRRVRFNVAGFFYKYNQIQTQSFPNEILLISNGAKAELYGVDLDFNAAVTDNFQLSAGLSLLQAEFTDFPNASLTIPQPGGGNAYSTIDATGFRLPQAPKAIFNAGANYTIPTNSGDFEISANYTYNDGWYPESDNRLRQKSYSVVNGQVRWSSPDDKFEIIVWGKNLFDEDYALTLFSQGSGDLIHWAPPRTYGVTVKAKF